MSTKAVDIQGNSLPVREFKLEWMAANPSICMIAKRGSGKSYVCRSILNHFKGLPGGMIIAPTDRMNTFYGKFFPDTYIHYQYKSEIIEKLLYRQKVMIEKMKKKYKEGKKCDPRTFLIMDDCLSSKGAWGKDQPVMQLFFDGRHYQIMYILTMQFPLGITPELRCNFDYIFLLAEDFTSNQKRIYDHYAGMFPDLNSFKQVFKILTDDYGCMVIVNRGANKNFLEKIFWYKANEEHIDQIGNNQFNKFHKNNYDPKWRLKENNFNEDKYFNRGKKARIVVDKITSGKR
jgi:hypothetical protein